MTYYDAVLKSLPKVTYKLNVPGTGYIDISGSNTVLAGTPIFVSPILNGNSKAMLLNSASGISTPTDIFISGEEDTPFSLEAWVLPTTFTGEVSVLSHNNIYDGITFDGDFIKFTVRFNVLDYYLDLYTDIYPGGGEGGTAEVKWAVPDFTEVYAVVAVYSPEKIQLYINGVLVDETNISIGQTQLGFIQVVSPNLHSGQSISGTEKIVVDGISIFNRILSNTEILEHFLAGRDIPSAADIVGKNRGTLWDGTQRDIAMQQTWNTLDDWKAGTAIDVSSASGILIPIKDQTTDLSLAGTWRGTMGLGSIPAATIYGVKASWNGDGNYTVAASFDGTTYTTLVNGQLIPTTDGMNPLGKVIDIKVTFTGGLLDDPAQVRDITLTTYGSNKIYGSSVSRDLLLTGAVSTALESNQPIERNQSAGLTYNGGYAQLKAHSAGTVRTNLCTNPSMETAGALVTTRANLVASPSFEIDAGNWANNGSGTTMEVSTAQSHVGTKSLRVVPAMENWGYFQGYPLCTPGKTYTFSVWVRSDITQNLTLRNYAPYGMDGPTVSCPANTWVRLYLTQLINPAAVNIYISIRRPDSSLATAFYMDAFMIEESSTLNPYFDGATSKTSFYGPDNNIVWNTQSGSYVNNAVTAPDQTTTAATLTLSAGNGNNWDIYKGFAGLTAGTSYMIQLYVKLGSATNFALVVNDALAWDTIGGKVFTSSDGLNTSEWREISYIFTEPSNRTGINLHLGANALIALNGSPQTAGTVYIWGLRISQLTGPYHGGDDFTYVWSGVANASTSLEQAPRVAGWFLETGVQAIKSSVSPISGASSVRLTNGGDIYTLGGAVSAGETFTFSTDYRTDGLVTGTPQLYLCAPAAGGVAVTLNLPLNQVSPTRFSITTTANGSGTDVLVALFAPTTGYAYFDNVLIEKTSVALPYFDGSTYGAAWTGTPNASTSVDNVYTVTNIAALELWVKPETITTNWNAIMDARPGYAVGWLQISGGTSPPIGTYQYEGASAVYINGLPVASGSRYAVVGEWVHLLYIPTTPFNSDLLLGRNNILTEPFLGQIGLLAVYPTSLTAAQALALYNSYAGPTTATAIDPAGITVAELANAYSGYVLNWTESGL